MRKLSTYGTPASAYGTMPKRVGDDTTPATESWLSSEWNPAFMSEIALHGLLDHTKVDEQDKETMDMTFINGTRISKYDIRALKVGLKVTTKMRNELAEFNKKFVGENSVFLIKNGTPRILTQFKEDPYVLELQDQYTTENKPKKLPTIGASYYQGKPQRQERCWSISFAQLLYLRSVTIVAVSSPTWSLCQSEIRELQRTHHPCHIA